MSLSTEMLMKPRYLVKMPYPHGLYEKNQVVEPDKNGFIPFTVHAPTHPGIPEAFPEIFEPLPWYTGRDLSDMPDYVKYKEFPEIIKKVRKWYEHGFDNDATDSFCPVDMYLPATKEEYDLYINKN